MLNLFIVGSRLRHKWADDIAITKHSISGVNGNKIKIIEVAPKDLEGEAPAIVYFHGGAFFMSYARRSPRQCTNVCSRGPLPGFCGGLPPIDHSTLPRCTGRFPVSIGMGVR